MRPNYMQILDIGTKVPASVKATQHVPEKGARFCFGSFAEGDAELTSTGKHATLAHADADI